MGFTLHSGNTTLKVALAPGGIDSKLRPAKSVIPAGSVTFLVKNYSRTRKEYGVVQTAEGHVLCNLYGHYAAGQYAGLKVVR